MSIDPAPAGEADHGHLAAFVTGAGSGIGRATAQRLARDGYTVGLLDLDAGAVQATVDGIPLGSHSSRQAMGASSTAASS